MSCSRLFIKKTAAYEAAVGFLSEVRSALTPATSRRRYDRDRFASFQNSLIASLKLLNGAIQAAHFRTAKFAIATTFHALGCNGPVGRQDRAVHFLQEPERTSCAVAR